ncbi:DNA-processing protein DprA, partial [Candidatus Woesebacteria bacterium]|nr:DNA-processing protein DprA [Candidatus Woesebacteria bacterium]
EAAEKSGSLITAQFALEYGRSVGAVSGPIHSPYAVGTQHLVNQGAKLILSAADILEDVGVISDANTLLTQSKEPEFHSAGEREVWHAIPEQMLFDELLETTGFSVSELTVFVSTLELRGLVRRAGVMVEKCA